MQLSVWQNCKLAFKILRFQKNTLTCDLKKHIFCVFKSQFLKMQFPNNLYSMIWFKISFIIYKIVISNVPLMIIILYKEHRQPPKA